MTGRQVNQFSAKVLIFLSVTALLAVLDGYTLPRQTD
jgi:hypothetical protein